MSTSKYGNESGFDKWSKPTDGAKPLNFIK